MIYTWIQILFEMANMRYVKYTIVTVLFASLISIAPSISYSQLVETTVEVDKSSYSIGETVSIGGIVPKAADGVPVVIQVFNPRNMLYSIDQVIPIGHHPPKAIPTPIPSRASDPTEQQPSGCLIATAAFGSELSPQVQFLRNFRDDGILSTTSGTSFMNVFNAWYYSFSPHIADYERNNPWLQQIVKTSMYPLIGILGISEKAYGLFNGEYGAIIAGLTASSMIGAVYFFPLALIIKQVRQYKISLRTILIIFGVIITSVLLGIVSNSIHLLMISTTALVLSTLVISAILSAKIFYKYIIQRTKLI